MLPSRAKAREVHELLGAFVTSPLRTEHSSGVGVVVLEAVLEEFQEDLEALWEHPGLDADKLTWAFVNMDLVDLESMRPDQWSQVRAIRRDGASLLETWERFCVALSYYSTYASAVERIGLAPESA